MSHTITEMTPEMLETMIATHKLLNPDLPIRPDVIESLNRYVTRGIPPGDFLSAVLENDLMEAMGRADSYNRATLYQICCYVYNKLPYNSHGSPEKVQRYRESVRQGDAS